MLAIQAYSNAILFLSFTLVNVTIITMCIVNSSHTDVIEPSNSSPSHLSTVVSLMSSEAQVRTTSGQWTVRIVAYCGT